MGQCESCVNSSKTAKGGENLSYHKGKKRHTKQTGSRRNSISTGSDYTGSKSNSMHEHQNLILNFAIFTILGGPNTSETTSQR